MTTGHCKIDWLSFTVPARSPFTGFAKDTIDHVLSLVSLYVGYEWPPVAWGHEWELEKGHRFYQHTIVYKESKIRLSFGDVNAHVYVEIGGQAQDFIRGRGGVEELLQKVGARASRIDLAIDWETETAVGDFIGDGYKSAYKTGGAVHSPDGDTVYVGSRKSERFARVYRYHEPHPRSRLLRAEVELKGDAAKAMCDIISQKGEVYGVLAAHNLIGWKSPLWTDMKAEVTKFPSRPYDRSGNGFYRWLYTTVIPALVKANNEGYVDLDDFIDKHIRPLLK